MDEQQLALITIIILSLCGIWVIWRDYLIWPSLKVPVPMYWLQRFTQPILRLHSRWSRMNQRGMMAKWRKGRYANKFYMAIHELIDEGVCSPQQGKQLQAQMAKFFGLDDLARIKTHQDAVKHRLMLNKIHEVGPAQEHPAWGGKPGEDIVPQYEVLGSKFLKRRKA